MGAGCGVCAYSNTVQCVVRHSGTDGHAIIYKPHNIFLCFSTMHCRSVHCSAVQCSAVQCSTMQCSAVQYSTVQCSAVQCSAVVAELYMSDVAAEVYISTDH